MHYGAGELRAYDDEQKFSKGLLTQIMSGIKNREFLYPCYTQGHGGIEASKCLEYIDTERGEGMDLLDKF